MKTIFVDSVGMLALWNKSDQWYEPARKANQIITANRWDIVTTTFVVLECGNAAARTPIRRDVVMFQRAMSKSNRLIVPSDDDWNLAWEAYGRGEAGGAGIVDHVSFVIMRRLGIRTVFTNDKHFEAAGFEVLF